jgi:hypothetical protein
VLARVPLALTPKGRQFYYAPLFFSGLGATSVSGLAKSLFDSGWFITKWGLILGLVGGAVAIPLLLDQVDEEIRALFERRLSAHYKLPVSVRSARWVQGEGIEIRGLTIHHAAQSGADEALCTIDEIFLHCDTNMRDLLEGMPRIRQVVLRRPLVRAKRQADGSWDAFALMHFPSPGPELPDISLENASVEFLDPQKPIASHYIIRDAQVKLTPGQRTGPVEQQVGYHLEGHLLGDYLRRLEFRGHTSVSLDQWTFQGTADGLDFSPELLTSLPSPLAQRLVSLESLRAQAKLDFQLCFTPAAPEPCQFTVNGEVVRGRIDDARLPYPLNDLKATFRCDNRSLVIHELSARNGETSLWLTCHAAGYEPNSPLAMNLVGRQLTLDHRLLELRGLPPHWRHQWDSFLPSGLVDCDIELTFDGQTWLPEVHIKCHNVSFTYARFPYRLERATGQIDFVDNQLDVGLRAFSNGEEVRVDAQWDYQGPHPAGFVAIKGNNIPFDNKFFDALDQRAASAMRQINPRGAFNFDARFWQDPAPAPPGFHYDIQGRVQHCSLRHERFPYPLDNVRGIVSITDGPWTFHNFRANNDSGEVVCEGRLEQTPEGRLLLLDFTGRNIALDDELRESLGDPHLAKLWSDLNPRGAIDVDSQFRLLLGNAKPEVRAVVHPRPEISSIEPRSLPYRLEQLEGRLVLQQQQVHIERLSGRHGRTQVVAQGIGSNTPGGGWQVHLRQLAIDRLDADRDLVQALPPRMREVTRQLNVRGPVNLHGSLTMSCGGGRNDPVTTDWDFQVNLHRNTLQCGVPLENVFGSVRLRGGYNGQRYGSAGELNLDSLFYRNMQFTEVRGPIYIDDRHVLLGAAAHPAGSAEAPRHITGRAYQGTILSDGVIRLTPTPHYVLDASLSGAELEQLSRDWMEGSQPVRGKVMGSVHLEGNDYAAGAAKGHGTINLRDANIYELRAMVSLLKVLSVKPPDPTAFTKSDINFRVDAGHLYFDQIHFIGDAVSLKGNGEMDFQGDVDLKFYACVGRAEGRVPLVGPLFREASQQFMQIQVAGPLRNPQITREHFPGVMHSLQQLQAELSRQSPERAPAFQPATSTPRPANSPAVANPATSRAPAATPAPTYR